VNFVVVTNLVLIEQVFSIPGVFQDLTDTVEADDVPLLLGMTMVGAGLVAITSIAVDAALAWIDPRVSVRALG